MVFGIMYRYSQGLVSQEQQLYGQSTASQLAKNLAQQVIDRDILSLNVLVTRLTTDEPIQFVAIYDDHNQLIAQSGKEIRNNESYSAEITFQDSMIGFVRVSVAPARRDLAVPLAIILLAAVAYLIGLIRGTPFLLRWIADQKRPPIEDESLVRPDKALPGNYEGCILVVRIRPSRHMALHFDKFYQAAKLYGGIIEQTTAEELVIHFELPDAMFMASCTGLLIQQITLKVDGNITFGGTLDMLDDEPDEIRKAASYLASISEGDLIVAGAGRLLENRVELQSFHHSLVDSQNLQTISGLVNQELLNSQANQLIVNVH
jgi:hypothetical protein